jgi:hypothetical protein
MTYNDSGGRVPADCRVVSDPTYSGRPRWSCDCGAALVRQPYMTETDWAGATTAFFSQHGRSEPDPVRE